MVAIKWGWDRQKRIDAQASPIPTEKCSNRVDSVGQLRRGTREAGHIRPL